MNEIQEIANLLQQTKATKTINSNHIKTLIVLAYQLSEANSAMHWYSIIDSICDIIASRSPIQIRLQTEECVKETERPTKYEFNKYLILLLFHILSKYSHLAKYILRAIFDCVTSPLESIEILSLLYLLSTYSHSFLIAMQEENKATILYELLQRCVNEGLKYETKKGVSSQYEDKIPNIHTFRSNINCEGKENKKVSR